MLEARAHADVLDPLIDALHRYASDRIDAARIDAEGRVPAQVLRDLGEMGVFGITIPERWGGTDLGLPAACTVVEALAMHDRSVATTVGLHLGLGTWGLVAFGSDPLRARLLPDLACGHRLAAFAATEPGAGSDLSRIATRATCGDTVRVDGTKIYVTNGGLAGVFTLLVATEAPGARRGHALVVVERDDRGVSVGPEEHKLGLRGSSTTSLTLDGVEVPADRVIGTPGQGMAHAAEILARGRTVMAAGCVGSASAALDAAVAHVTLRRQFGRRLVDLDVVRGQLADMTATRFAMRALVHRAAVAREPLLPSIAAKVVCSEGNWEVCDTAVQLHGGSGFIEDTGLPLLLRDARITRIFEGANDVLLTHAGASEASDPGGEGTSGADPLVRAAAAWRRRVALSRDRLVRRHGLGLLRRPADLHRLGRLVVLRESVGAAVWRATWDQAPVARALAFRWLAMVERKALSPAVDEDVEPVIHALAQGVAP